MTGRRYLAPFLGAAIATLTLVTPVAAAPLRNDDIDSPTVVGAIPYSNSQNTERASTGDTDPGFCFDPQGPADANTVWYSYTATEDARLAANTFGSDYDTTLYVGTTNDAGGIDVIGCTDDSGGTLQSYVAFDAVAGTTYLVAIGTCCGSPGGDGGGSLVFGLGVAEPQTVLEVTIDPIGQLDGNVVTLTGTLACSPEADFAFVDIILSQRVGKRTIEGSGFGEVFPCTTSPTTWVAFVEGFNGRFAGGNASASLFASTCDLECVSVEVVANIKLR